VNVTFLNIKATYARLKNEIDEAYHRVMESGWYILGKEVSAFEQELSNILADQKEEEVVSDT